MQSLDISETTIQVSRYRWLTWVTFSTRIARPRGSNKSSLLDLVLLLYQSLLLAIRMLYLRIRLVGMQRRSVCLYLGRRCAWLSDCLDLALCSLAAPYTVEVPAKASIKLNTPVQQLDASHIVGGTSLLGVRTLASIQVYSLSARHPTLRFLQHEPALDRKSVV